MITSGNQTFLDDREKTVLDYLHHQGQIRVSDVSDLLGISPSTSRLLLQRMQEAGLLQRIRGGAILPESKQSTNIPKDYTTIENREAKLKIAQLAADTVSDGDYICLGSGTTVFLMATLLHGKQDLTVVTDSIPIANELYWDEGITVHLCGGWVMKRNSACRGVKAENFFKDIVVDKAYNGAGSINPELGATSVDFDPRTETAICHCGKICYILADHSKFVRRPYIECVIDIDHIDTIVTDQTLSEEQLKQLKDRQVRVITP